MNKKHYMESIWSTKATMDTLAIALRVLAISMIISIANAKTATTYVRNAGKKFETDTDVYEAGSCTSCDLSLGRFHMLLFPGAVPSQRVCSILCRIKAGELKKECTAFQIRRLNFLKKKVWKCGKS